MCQPRQNDRAGRAIPMEGETCLMIFYHSGNEWPILTHVFVPPFSIGRYNLSWGKEAFLLLNRLLLVIILWQPTTMPYCYFPQFLPDIDGNTDILLPRWTCLLERTFMPLMAGTGGEASANYYSGQATTVLNMKGLVLIRQFCAYLNLWQCYSGGATLTIIWGKWMSDSMTSLPCPWTSSPDSEKQYSVDSAGMSSVCMCLNRRPWLEKRHLLWACLLRACKTWTLLLWGCVYSEKGVPSDWRHWGGEAFSILFVTPEVALMEALCMPSILPVKWPDPTNQWWCDNLTNDSGGGDSDSETLFSFPLFYSGNL